VMVHEERDLPARLFPEMIWRMMNISGKVDDREPEEYPESLPDSRSLSSVRMFQGVDPKDEHGEVGRGE